MADGMCSGEVVDASGRPVAHALVSIVGGPAAWPEIALMADDRGRFELSLPPGEWTFQANSTSGQGQAGVLVRQHDTAPLVITLRSEQRL